MQQIWQNKKKELSPITRNDGNPDHGPAEPDQSVLTGTTILGKRYESGAQNTAPEDIPQINQLGISKDQISLNSRESETLKIPDAFEHEQPTLPRCSPDTNQGFHQQDLTVECPIEIDASSSQSSTTADAPICHGYLDSLTTQERAALEKVQNLTQAWLDMIVGQECDYSLYAYPGVPEFADHVGDCCKVLNITNPSLRVAAIDAMLENIKQFFEWGQDNLDNGLWTMTIESLQQKMLSHGNTLPELVSLSEALLLTTKFTRSAVGQAFFGPSMSRSLVYAIEKADAVEIGACRQRLSALPALELADVLNQITTIAAIGVTKKTPILVEKAQALIADIAQSSKSPFVDIGCRIAQRRIEAEKMSPSLVPEIPENLNRSARATHSRLADNLTELEQRQDRELSCRAHFVFGSSESEPHPEWKKLWVAADCIGLFDESLQLKAIGRIEDDQLKAKRTVDIRAVQKAIHSLYVLEDYSHRFDRHKILLSVIDLISKEMFVPLREAGEFAESQGHFFSELVGVFKAQEWQSFFDGHPHGKPNENSHILVDERHCLGYARELRTALERWKAAESRKLPTVRLQWVEEIISDPALCPFPINGGDDVGLLLSILGQRSMLREFESDLGLAVQDSQGNITGISLRERSARELLHFMRFAVGQNKEQFHKLKSALAEHNQSSREILRSFVACAEDLNKGSLILNIANSLSASKAQLIFGKFNEIVDASQNIEASFVAEYGPAATGVDLDLVRRNQLRGANRLLSDYAHHLEKDSSEQQIITLLSGLTQVHSSTVLFAAIFESIKAEARQKGHQIPALSELQHVSITRVPAAELDSTTKNELQRILEWNWKVDADEIPEMIAIAQRGFENSLSNPDCEYFLIRHDEEILVSRRITHLENGELLFGGFNVRPEVHASGLGGAMAKMMLEQYGKDHPIVIDVSVRNPQLKHLQDQYGFKPIKEYRTDDGTIFCYRLRREPGPAQ